LCSAEFRASWEVVVTNLGRSSAICRVGAAVLTAGAALLASAHQPAAAQGLFESLFGFGPRYVRPQPLPPQTSSYADPYGEPENRRSVGDGGYTGRSTAFCVRTCDGRYFPLQRHAGASPAEMCHSFCPAAKTAVFSGGSIDHAVAHNGARYADLDNAFAYRDRVVENCTCNGKDGLGLARLSAVSDPTLRPGDIVATNDGLVNFHGKSSRSAEFTPISASSSAWAQKLSEVKVRPAPPSQHVVEVTAPDNKEADKPARRDRRRVQR
jgi:hypothetical protein